MVDEMKKDRPLPTLTEDPMTWKDSSILSVNQITTGGLHLLFTESQLMRNLVRENGGGNQSLQHRVLGTVFFEASTRTSCSFQAAITRLGGNYIHVDGQSGSNSSAGKKGETLTDTCKCLECYTDATVLRHPINGSVQSFYNLASKPVINAGDGIGEHPTQALLDLYTIYDELKLSSSNLVAKDGSTTNPLPPPPLIVVLLGDLKHGRTVHSLTKLLCTSGIWGTHLILRYCAPNGLEIPQYIHEYCQQFQSLGVVQENHTDLKTACDGANVLYVTRIQRERFETDEAYESVKGSYVVDKELLQSCPNDMIVMHPLPRVDEIHVNVDTDPRAAYFRQMENGLYVRMAILSLILRK